MRSDFVRKKDVGSAGNGGEFAATGFVPADDDVTFLEDLDSFAPPAKRQSSCVTAEAPDTEGAPSEAEDSDPITRLNAEIVRTLADAGPAGVPREAEIRRIGEMVATQSEDAAGITGEEIRVRSREREEQATAERDEANETTTRLNAEFEATLARRRSGQWSDGDEEERERLVIEGGAHRERIDRVSQQYVRTKLGSDEETAGELRRLSDGGYLQTLSQVRSMGGELPALDSSHPMATRRVNEAAGVYPNDWVQMSNEYPVRLRAANSRGRAHYAHMAATPVKKELKDTTIRPEMADDELKSRDPSFGDFVDASPDAPSVDGYRDYSRTVYEVARGSAKRTRSGKPYGPGWEQWTHPDDPTVSVWRRPQTRTDFDREGPATAELTASPSAGPVPQGRVNGFDVSVHEFSHRCEYTVPGITQAEHDFLDSRVDRTTSVRFKQKGMGRERYFPGGGFVSDYVAKDYSSTNNPAQGRAPTEVMAVGMEALFGTRRGGLVGAGSVNRSDDGHRNFVLGALALLGRRAR
jgi:hypothetical protein